MEGLRKTFETTRLKLRPLAFGDEKVIFIHISDDLTKHWIGWEKSETVEIEQQKTGKKLMQMKSGQEIHFLAFDKGTNEFIGICGIEPDMISQEDKEINVWVKKESQNKGYATEMIKGLLDQVRKNTNLSYLIYSVTKGNMGSQAIADKLELSAFRTFEAMKRDQKREVTDYKIFL